LPAGGLEDRSWLRLQASNDADDARGQPRRRLPIPELDAAAPSDPARVFRLGRKASGHDGIVLQIAPKHMTHSRVKGLGLGLGVFGAVSLAHGVAAAQIVA